MTHYDYIIAGAGCAGRSLAVRLAPYLQSSGKKVLLIDTAPKRINDRTWCFWETEADIFEPIVYKAWDSISLKGSKIARTLEVGPYTYKMIRGADFYAFTDKIISENKNITVHYGNIENILSASEKATVTLDGISFTADYIFSSIPSERPKDPSSYTYLLQHFTGWTISTKEEIFDPTTATLMDFHTPQGDSTAFVYVLPFNKHTALVEYTVFSPKVLEAEEYATALDTYLREQLGCKDYSILEREYGVIPMTDHPGLKNEKRIIHLGTAGGYTKGSTGYTFRFIQKHTKAIAASLELFGSPIISSLYPSRFDTYDGVLLQVLANGKLTGEEVFSTLFEKNRIQQVLKFLDNETSLAEEVCIFASLDKIEFSKAFFKKQFRF